MFNNFLVNSELGSYEIFLVDIIPQDDGGEIWIVRVNRAIGESVRLSPDSYLRVIFGRTGQLHNVVFKGESHGARLELTQSAMVLNEEIMNSQSSPGISNNELLHMGKAQVVAVRNALESYVPGEETLRFYQKWISANST